MLMLRCNDDTTTMMRSDEHNKSKDARIDHVADAVVGNENKESVCACKRDATRDRDATVVYSNSHSVTFTPRIHRIIKEFK